MRPYLEKPYHKKLGWGSGLKVKALSLSPSSEKKKWINSVAIYFHNLKHH
jgi:hypothetical protein